MLLRINKALRQMKRNSEGTVAIEFGLGVGILLMMMMGIIEVGMMLLVNSLVDGGLRQASRYGITGYEEMGTNRMEEIIQIVSDHTLGFVDLSSANLEILVYPSFSDVGNGEAFVDGNGNGTFDDGETFTDSNGNGARDSDMGVAGAGGAGDVVVYRLTYDWSFFTPMVSYFLPEGMDKLTFESSVAVRNEPWERVS